MIKKLLLMIIITIVALGYYCSCAPKSELPPQPDEIKIGYISSITYMVGAHFDKYTAIQFTDGTSFTCNYLVKNKIPTKNLVKFDIRNCKISEAE